MSLLKPALVVVLAAPLLASGRPPSEDGLVVHEWGTFTSVAGQDGNPVTWLPFSGPPDLPCFVHRLGGRNFKLAYGTVRMETPVVYFYPSRPVTLSVHVGFPQGLITEWYPQATRVTLDFSNPQSGQSNLKPQIEWDSIGVSAEDTPDFPVEKAASRYYTARETDSAVVRAGQEQEKLIFYRGIGNFSVPLRANITSEGAVEARTTGPDPIPVMILFENRAGQMSYRISRDLQGATKLEAPELAGNIETLGEELKTVMVNLGLYPKEAHAMVETWRDSWFEEGTRLLYIVPRATVDRVLPLTIAPAPAEVTRVFVGRIEILSPWMEESLATALTTGDVHGLGKRGRFLSAFADQIVQKRGEAVLSPTAKSFLQTAYARVQREFDSPACVK